MEDKTIEGKVDRDIYGPWEDCSPGIYIGSDMVETILRDYEGKHIRLSIEVLPEPIEDKQTIARTIGELMERYDWVEICYEMGWNEYMVKEGRADKDDIMRLPVSKAKKLGIIS